MLILMQTSTTKLDIKKNIAGVTYQPLSRAVYDVTGSFLCGLGKKVMFFEFNVLMFNVF